MKRFFKLLIAASIAVLTFTAAITVVSAVNPIEISSAEDLTGISMDGNYILKADIDLTGKDFTPIGSETQPFTGTFDGNGYSVKGLNLTKVNMYNGFFGVCKDAKITNLTVCDSQIDISTNINSDIYAALICASATGATEFTGCTASGTIDISAAGDVYAAGICAYADRNIILGPDAPAFKLCVNRTDITVDTSIYASSDVRIAGIAAYGVSSAIELSQNDGNLSANSPLGATVAGISAEYGYKSVDKCVNNGAVSSKSTSGHAIAGGIVAFTTFGTVSNSYNTGKISAESKDAYAGGICADSKQENSFTLCYNAGEVELYSSGYSGLLLAASSASDTFASNYVLDITGVDEIGQNAAGKTVVRLTDEQMKSSVNFDGFDFEDTWYMPESGTYLYPMLKGLSSTPLCGDVNGDGVVNSLDSVVLERYLANWSGYAQSIVESNCDVDGKNGITSIDAVILARHLANWNGYTALPYAG